MSSKAEIDIEFKKAIDQADELDEISQALCSIGNAKMDDALTLLTRFWKGENAALYMKNSRKMKDSMYAAAEILKDTSIMIRTTAKLIYAAEMAAVLVCNS